MNRLIVAGIALLALTATATSPAQVGGRRWVFLSTRPDEPATREPADSIRNALLRPNVEEPFYVYVRNATERDQDLVVALLAGEAEIARAEVRATARTTVRVRPPQTPPVPPAAPGSKAAPPAGMTVMDRVTLRVLDKATNEELDRSAIPVRIQRPSQFVTASAKYEGEPGSIRARLAVTVKDKTPSTPFTGPVAKVTLEVSPDRIPGLIPESVRAGSFRGDLQPGGAVTLTAGGLRFRGTDRRGVVAVGVDEYERAFLYNTDFSGAVPQPVETPSLRIAAPKYAQPGKPLSVRLEVDNPPQEDVRVEFAFDRGGTDEYTPSPLRTGDRARAITARWDGAAGGLVFTTVVRDWTEDVDTKDLAGARRMRLRLLAPAGAELIPPAFATVIFDDSAPEGIRFARLPKAIRNKPLAVTAYATDPESGVARAQFFLGEPPPPEPKPGTPKPVEGTVSTPVEGVVTARGNVALPDRTGKLMLGVRFTNNAGLTRDYTDEIEVAEPPPKPTTAKIKVKVLQGSDVPRPQPGLEVKLFDEKGKTEVTSGKTSDKGEYTFEDVTPGKYIVYTPRPEDKTKAQQFVNVKAGDEPTITLTLKR